MDNSTSVAGADCAPEVVREAGSHPSRPVLAIVVPCYNEQEVLPITSRVLADKVGALVAAGRVAPGSHVLLVDDGSRDATWQIICDLNSSAEHPHLFHGLKLAHNRGHQNALLAGLEHALASGVDVTVSMDADLQDDPNAVDEMLERYQEGCEIVYGVRSSRETDTGFKRSTALAFYGLMRRLGVEMVSDSADYRLMSARALEALMRYREVNLFLRGIVPMLGFKTAEVYYRRGERAAGESKYPLRKMVAFAMEGITSLSVKPVQWVINAALLSLLVSFACIIYALVSLACGSAVSGWTSVLVSIWLVGGLTMLCLGVVGEYVGKIYLETKARPRYEVERVLE